MEKVRCRVWVWMSGYDWKYYFAHWKFAWTVRLPMISQYWFWRRTLTGIYFHFFLLHLLLCSDGRARAPALFRNCWIPKKMKSRFRVFLSFFLCSAHEERTACAKCNLEWVCCKQNNWTKCMFVRMNFVALVVCHVMSTLNNIFATQISVKRVNMKKKQRKKLNLFFWCWSKNRFSFDSFNIRRKESEKETESTASNGVGLVSGLF